MKRRLAFRVLVAVTLGIYATMLVWTLPGIATDAGSPAFDMRPGGYSVDEARGFLTALSEKGRALYLGPQHLLDMFYPACLAATIIWSSHWAAAGHLRWILRLIVVAAVLGMGADYAENILVAGLLEQPADAVDTTRIGLASMLTITKSALTTLAMCLWLVLLARRLFLWLKRGNARA